MRNTDIRARDASERFNLGADFSKTVLLFNDIQNSEKIYYSSDGINWNFFASPARAANGSGGFCSIYMDSLVAGSYSILVSNKLHFFQADITGASPATAISRFNNTNPVTWSARIQPGHDDTRHFIKFPGIANKIIMTSDGGVHSSSFNYANRLRYSWITDNTSSGLNNLDIYNLTGTNESVNFGTQHNGFGVLNNDFTLRGQGHNEGYLLNRRGFGAFAPRTVLFAPDNNGPTGLRFQDAALGEPQIIACPRPFILWSGPNDGWGNPVWMGNRIYIQDARPAAGSRDVYPWSISFNDGCSWQNLPSTSNERSDKNAYLSTNRNGSQFLTSSILTSTGKKLARLINPTNPTTASWTYPAMRLLTDGIWYTGADYYYYPLYAVSPTNADSIFAVEKSTAKLKLSTNGGYDWDEVTSLHSYFVAEGELLKSVKGKNQITAVAFSPFDSKLILVGTCTAGLFISYTGGDSWTRLIETGLMNITDFHWKNGVDVVVSTYGHGLYKLRL